MNLDAGNSVSWISDSAVKKVQERVDSLFYLFGYFWLKTFVCKITTQWLLNAANAVTVILRLLNIIYMNLIDLYNIIDSGDESMLLDIYLYYNFSSQFIFKSCYVMWGFQVRLMASLLVSV